MPHNNQHLPLNNAHPMFVVFIIDVDHDPRERERTVMRIFVREGDKFRIIREQYEPYFYVIPLEEGAKEKIERMEGVTRVEVVEREVGREKKQVLQVFVRHPKYMQKVKEAVEERGIGEGREHDISVEKKFMMERGYNYMEGEEEPRIVAIDLEVYARDRMPDPRQDPIIMISWVDSEGRKLVLTTKDIKLPFVRKCESEIHMINELTRLINEFDPDIILGYNSDAFDLPYLKERAKTLGVRIPWGRDGSEPKIRRPRGSSTVDIVGRMHVDVFRIVEFLAGIGAIDVFKLDLENVYKAVLGKDKVKINHRDIAFEWREGDLEKLALYNLQDSIACYELGIQFLDLFIELSKILKVNLYEASRLSPSQIVEHRLIFEAFKRGKVVPKRPKAEIVAQRMRVTYQGAFVKEPLPGLHENIAVLDFRSLYPSIIITYNVDPDTLNGDCRERYVSPIGHYFCKEPRGLIPSMLEVVLQERFKYKREMKQYPKGSKEYKVLYAKQMAFKIIANSTYGYLGFPMARWYSRECAEAITAWGRKYIQEVMRRAEEFGFKVLYGDTDSIFLILPKGWGKEKVMEFLERINKELPGWMHLEFEGLYKRGLFITKRKEARAAKKKYALVDEKGNLKIVGMEFVRRDWAEIAKQTQRKVLEYVLIEGDPKKALEYVRKVIDDLRAKRVPKEALIIYTQIQKDLHAYEQKGPHVMAALKAMRRGVKIVPGMLIGYIIKEGAGKISDRAELAQFVGEKEYDPEYYINNQVLPAVMPILEELGFTERDVKRGEAQKTLFDFT